MWRTEMYPACRCGTSERPPVDSDSSTPEGCANICQRKQKHLQVLPHCSSWSHTTIAYFSSELDKHPHSNPWTLADWVKLNSKSWSCPRPISLTLPCRACQLPEAFHSSMAKMQTMGKTANPTWFSTVFIRFRHPMLPLPVPQQHKVPHSQSRQVQHRAGWSLSKRPA